jgi:hypothetical protein
VSDELIYEIYSIRYARHDRPSSDNFIGGDVHDVLQPLVYFIWAIVGPSGPLIVDTGFDEAVGKKRGREKSPVGVVGQLCMGSIGPL